MITDSHDHLRHLLAERVMGWEKRTINFADAWCMADRVGNQIAMWHAEWQPDVIIEQAMMVKNALVKRGYSFILIDWGIVNQSGYRYSAIFSPMNADMLVGMSGATEDQGDAFAICLAAIMLYNDEFPVVAGPPA